MIVVERISPEGTAHRITIGAHELIVDMKTVDGGAGEGPDPHDLYDAALGACKALTMLLYARRRNMPVEDIQVTVDRDDSEERKGIYRLKTSLRVTGTLDETQRAELLRVAGKCPIHKLMTEATIEVETGWA